MIRYPLLVMTTILASSALNTQADPRVRLQGQGVDEMIAAFMAEHDVPGMSLAVAQAQSITKVSSYGLADVSCHTPVTNNTVFDIGQIRHANIAIAIMQLVESHKLKLDDLLIQHLPSETNSRETLREAFLDIKKYPLLEKVISKAAGEDYQRFVQKEQFDRLGLRQTFFANPAIPPEAPMNPTKPAIGYQEKDGKLKIAPPGENALYSSPHDMSTWTLGFAGDLLVKDAQLRGVLFQTPARDVSGSPSEQPWRHSGYDGFVTITNTGHGFSSSLSRFTKTDASVCISLCANKEGLDLTQLARKIAGAYDTKLGPPPNTSNMRIQQSPHSVPKTIDRLEKILKDRGVGIIARIDHRKAAQSKELELRPTEELIFGNPAMGTPLMQSNPAITVDLPLRAAAWEENGEIWLAATDPLEIAHRHGIKDHEKLLQQMRDGIDSALLKATSSDPL